MVTLADVTEKTRFLMKWGAVSFIGLIILIVLFRIGSAVKEILYPTPPPPPTVGYGKLPKIAFGQSTTTKTFTYSINTVSGTLPEISDRAEVFAIVKPETNLLAPRTAQETVAKLGFEQPGVRISDNSYQWSDQGFFQRVLVLNVYSYNFSLSSNFLTNPVAISAQYVPSQKRATELAKIFLSDLNAMPKDIDLDKTNVSLFSIQNGNLIGATSLSTAQVVRVDFFQKDIAQKDPTLSKQVKSVPIYYSNPLNAPMNIYIASRDQEGGVVVAAKFFHQTISDTYETYPLRKVSEAFSSLENGEGYIASHFGNDSAVSIKNVTLGYFMGNGEQSYLMPIYVFEGDNGFFAYISAARADFVEE